MSNKLWSEQNPGPGPLIVDAPLVDAERLKKESNFNR